MRARHRFPRQRFLLQENAGSLVEHDPPGLQGHGIAQGSFEALHEHFDPAGSRPLMVQRGRPAHDRKAMVLQETGDVGEEGAGDFALERSGPSLELRHVELVVSGPGYDLGAVEIIGNVNGTDGEGEGLAGGRPSRERGPVVQRLQLVEPRRRAGAPGEDDREHHGSETMTMPAGVVLHFSVRCHEISL
jgi:hypothetical protein